MLDSITSSSSAVEALGLVLDLGDVEARLEIETSAGALLEVESTTQVEAPRVTELCSWKPFCRARGVPTPPRRPG